MCGGGREREKGEGEGRGKGRGKGESEDSLVELVFLSVPVPRCACRGQTTWEARVSLRGPKACIYVPRSAGAFRFQGLNLGVRVVQ